MAEIKFTGNLGRDADLKFTPSGRAVLNFSVADSKSKPDGNGGWDKIAEQWLNVAVWGELAEFYSDKLAQGARVTVYGEFYSRKYETKEGVPGVSLDVIAKGIDIHPPKNGQQRQQSGNQAQGGQQNAEDPWATPGVSNAGGWGNGPDSEPPF